MKNRNVTLGFALLIVLSLISVTGWFAFKPAPVIIQGEVDATEVKVASKLVGRIEDLHVKEGNKVKKGQLLLELNSPEVQAKLKQAKAAKAAATAQNLKADNGAREEQIDAAKNVWLKAKAAAELTEKTYQRVLNLYKEGVIPAQKRDEAETQMKAAKLTEQAAKSNYDMARNGARNEDKMAARALVDQADGAVNEVESYISETRLTAPIDGEISNIIAEQGELIGSGLPVISIVDLKDVWITFNLREDLVAKLKKGTEFSAKFPALGGKEIKLKVTYLKVEADYASWRATKATGSFDMKTFEVRAEPVEKVEGLRPGMTAVVNWTELN